MNGVGGLHPGGEIVVSMSRERWLHNPIARARIEVSGEDCRARFERWMLPLCLMATARSIAAWSGSPQIRHQPTISHESAGRPVKKPWKLGR
jgi:hypothetical protein